MSSIAIQLHGDLRNWDRGRSVWLAIKAYIEKRLGLDVDIYGFFWLNDYSRSCNFDLMTVKLSEIPKVGIVDKEERGIKPRGMYPWAYALFQANKIRKLSFKKHDIVFSCRPDYLLSNDQVESSIRVLQGNTKHDRFSMIYDSHNGVNKWHFHKTGNDNGFCGFSEAIDLFSTAFHLCYLDKDPSFYPTNHNVQGLVIDRYNINSLYGNITGRILREFPDFSFKDIDEFIYDNWKAYLDIYK